VAFEHELLDRRSADHVAHNLLDRGVDVAVQILRRSDSRRSVDDDSPAQLR
jgi:hypothetical protein